MFALLGKVAPLWDPESGQLHHLVKNPVSVEETLYLLGFFVVLQVGGGVVITIISLYSNVHNAYSLYLQTKNFKGINST